jgi:hypothetical protein
MKQFMLVLMTLVSLAMAAGAAEDAGKAGTLTTPSGAAEEKRTPGPLVVYGDDFMFAIKEPEGWTADIETRPSCRQGSSSTRRPRPLRSIVS